MCAAIVPCVMLLLSLCLCGGEGIPATDVRSAAKKFQNALTQQSLQTVLLSIEERLRNLDNVYAMQYSPGVEGRFDMYVRKLDGVEAKLSRLEAVMGNEMNKISENISGRNFKDDLARDQALRKIDSLYERMNHRMIFAESKMELIERKLENKLDTVVSQMEKIEESLEIKDADMHNEISEVLTCIDDLKSQSVTVEQKLANISKTLINVALFRSDEASLTQASENITEAVKKDMKENFEVLSNKMVDFHETSWQTYERLERTLRSMSLVANLTRYETQNGLRSLTVEVGRLSGGQVLLSDSSKEKSKLHEIDKKIDSNFESLMLAQNLFMENCYRLQRDEPQLETKISEVLNEMLNTFKSKTAIGPRDIKKLEQIMRNHDQGVKGALKGLNTILHKSHVTNAKIEDGLNSLSSIDMKLDAISSSSCEYGNDTKELIEKLKDTMVLLKHIQGSQNFTKATTSDTMNPTNIERRNLTATSHQEAMLKSIMDYVERMNATIADIENKTNSIGFLFTDQYKRHLKLFLDEYAKSYMDKISAIFQNNSRKIVKANNRKLYGDIDEKKLKSCFLIADPGKNENDSLVQCIKQFVSDDVYKTIIEDCGNVNITQCLKTIIGLESENTFANLNSTLKRAIKINCIPNTFVPHFNCLSPVLNTNEIEKVKRYCRLFGSLEDCLRNISDATPGEIIVTKLDQNIVRIIKSNCSSQTHTVDNPTLSFDCIERILTNKDIANVRSYCDFNNFTAEEDCLRYINQINLDVDDFIRKINETVINIIDANCFPQIDLRFSNDVSIPGCLKGVLDETLILNIQNYCSDNMISSDEECLKSLINRSNRSTEDFGKLVEKIKEECREKEILLNCTFQILDEISFTKIRNHCETRNMSLEGCLRNITRDNLNISHRISIDRQIRESIRSKCFPLLDVRDSTDSLSLDCLVGILNETDIRAVRSYCSKNIISSEVACINSLIDVDVSEANVERHDSPEDSTRQVDLKNGANRAETTTSTESYPPSDRTEGADYDDYSADVY